MVQSSFMTHSPSCYEGRDLEAMGSAPNYYDWIFSEFEPYLSENVVEVGAGSGNFSSLLIGKRVGGKIKKLLAIEPSEQMYPLLKERFRSDPRVSCEQGYFADVALRYAGAFDTAIYINVFEHIEHDDQELKRVYEALPPGGHVCIYVPALPSLYSDFDKDIGHYRRYTKAYLAARLKEAGFDIVKLRYFDIAGILPWFIVIRLLRFPVTGGGAGLYDRIAVPIMRRIETLITPPIGKNLLAVAKKAS